MKINWLITDQSIILNYESQTHILLRTDLWADKIIAALKDNKYDEIPAMVSNAKRIENMSGGRATVKDGEVLMDGEVVGSVLTRKIKEFADAGLPYEPLVKFQEKLNKNPSKRSVEQLYAFLDKNNHPITEDGDFIAYKRIRPNYKDIHSGTMDNFPGLTVNMAREEVDDDPNRTCSKGLHCGSFEYCRDHFGGPGDIMVEVKVNPQNVVSVPIDYNNAKMRVCEYRVIGIIDNELSTALRKYDDTFKLCSFCSEPMNKDNVCLSCQCNKCFTVLDNGICKKCEKHNEG